MSLEGSISLVQIVWLAVLQGVTELFPVSSLGHAVVLPHLLGWNVDQNSETFLPLLVALHLGTATALLVYFRHDWWTLLSSLIGPVRCETTAEARRTLLLLVLGTIPAGLLGLALEKRLAALFGSYQVAAVFLVINGLLLVLGEWLRRRERLGKLSDLRPGQAILIGASQALALVPGISRSGATLVGGLLVGLSHEAAARFSFLLATPIIGAAAVLELPKLVRTDLRADLEPALVGGVAAGVTAYISTAVLMRYFKQREANALVPFGIYCAVVGVATLLV